MLTPGLMVTTKKWVRGATATGGPLAVSVRRLIPAVLSCSLCLGLAMILAGCGEPTGGRELSQGIRLLEAGKPAEAVVLFQRASELLVTNQVAHANAFNYLGLAHHRAGQTDAANRAYQAAINEDLNLVAARYNRGCLLLELGEFDEAARELTTYVGHRPEAAEGWLRLGSARLRAGRVPEAEEAFKRAGQLSGERRVQVEALNGAGVCLVRRGRGVDGGAFFDAANNLDPKYAPVLLNQAILAEQQRDQILALSKYQVWFENAGNDPARPEVEAHVQRLILALQPALAAGGTATQEQLARLTNLFSRVGSVAEVAAATPATNPPPAVVVNSNPPPVVVAASNLPPVIVVASNPPPVVVAASNPPPVVVATAPAPVLVTALPPHRPGIDTSTPPALRVALEPPPVPATTPASSAILVTSPSSSRADTLKPAAEDPSAATAANSAATEVVLVEESVPSRPQLAMAVRVPAQPIVAPEPDPRTSDITPEPEGTGDEVDAGEPGEKRSFFSRINPVNLFRREPKEKRVTPLPPREDAAGSEGDDSAGVAASAAVAPLVATTSVATTISVIPEPAAIEPARPAYPRYTYLSPARPEPGDAEKAGRLLDEAAGAHQAGRYAEAAEGYRKALKADPACFGARYNLGTLELDRLRPDMALPEFETALVVSPGAASARFNFALAMEAAGYPLDAAIEMERVTDREPGNVAAHLMLGGLYSSRLADQAQAREHFVRVLELAPHHPQADRIRRWLSVNR